MYARLKKKKNMKNPSSQSNTVWWDEIKGRPHDWAGEGLLSQEVHILPLQSRDRAEEEVVCSRLSECSSQGYGLIPGLRECACEYGNGTHTHLLVFINRAPGGRVLNYHSHHC